MVEVAALIDIKVKKLYPDAIIPTKAHDTDAGWDLYAHHFDNDESCLASRIHNGDCVKINTGISVEIPVGYCGLIFDRSGLGSKGIMRLMGVIDAGYRGEIVVGLTKAGIIHNVAEYVDVIKNSKIAQMLIVPVPVTQMVEVKELSSSERGDKGFGSSGD